MTSPSLRQLAWVTARDVTRTVGGGYASMELLRRTFSARGWLDAAGHAVIVAVSRLTPGTNILAYCAGVGWWFHGMAGGVTAVLGASIPSSVVIAALSAGLVRADEYRSVQVLLAVGALVASVLVFSAAWNLVRPYLAGGTRVRAVSLLAVAWILAGLGLTPVRVVLAAAAIGVLMPARARQSPAAESV